MLLVEAIKRGKMGVKKIRNENKDGRHMKMTREGETSPEDKNEEVLKF